jgi:hypothetical protein
VVGGRGRSWELRVAIVVVSVVFYFLKEQWRAIKEHNIVPILEYTASVIICMATARFIKRPILKCLTQSPCYRTYEPVISVDMPTFS